MRPRPDPPKNVSIVIPGKPPATSGLVIDPGMTVPAGGARPNDCCRASEFARDHEKRNSLTIAEDRMCVHPPTSAWVLIVWLPKAEVPVPSITPPNAPGICRFRFE